MKAPLWATYFMCRGESFGTFWRERSQSSEVRLLLVSGAGFDPRAMKAARVIHEAGATIVACRLVNFEEGPESASRQYMDHAQCNREELGKLLRDASIDEVPVEMRRSDGRSIGGRRISEAFRDAATYADFTDVVVDITALPRGLYYPLLGTLLDLWDPPVGRADLGNLHVVVCENPGVDLKIEEEGGDRAECVHGFSGGLSLTSTGDSPLIWAPVLGERQQTRLRKIAESLKASEICPVLPFPAANPRRGDRLIIEYRELLFERWTVEPRDILYADEQNPFDVYRQLCRLDERYSSALRSLGPVKTVVSAHSSKLLSLGVLLAAFERQLAVPHVEPTGYMVSDGFQPGDADGELFEIWLAGEAYAPN